ncbi:MAG: hypothetical protein ACKV2V_17445 [Blastocatellia bacterium]
MRTTRLCLFLLSLSLVLPGLAPAAYAVAPARNERAAMPAVRVSAPRAYGPIGAFAAAGRLVINGRNVENNGALWDGETLHTPIGSAATVNLAGIGQVALRGGTMARLTTATLSDNPGGPRVLTAAMVSGEMALQLTPGASACLFAGGRTFYAAAGSRFRLSMYGGRPVMTSEAGVARDFGAWGVRAPALAAAPKMPAATRRPLLTEAEAGIVSWPAVLPPLEPAAIAEKPAAPAQINDIHPKGSAPDINDARRTAFLRSLRAMNNSAGISAYAAAAPDKNLVPRLAANPMEGMIGMVEAPAAMKINGRAVRGREMLWDGEIIEAPANAAARVTLTGVGSLSIAAAARVRVGSAMMQPDNGAARRVLVASVINGDCFIRLQDQAAAFLNANGYAFAADGGSHFRLTAREGRAVADVLGGVVESIGRYVVELTPPAIDVINTLREDKIKKAGRQYRVIPVGATQQGLVPLKATRELRYKIIDDTGVPAAGVPVNFTLTALDKGAAPLSFGSGLVNALTWTGVTGPDGMVTIPVMAGEKPGSAAVHVSVADAPPVQAGRATAAGSEGFWSTKNALPVFLTAGAMIGIGAATYTNRTERFPIKGDGPTIIVP